MAPRSPLPPTVAGDWTPRDEAWLAQAPSPFDGRPGRPLFIGACPRSGTTLLRAMLDNHPEIAIPHETNFVRPLWWQRVQFGDLRDDANRRRVAEWIFTGKERRGGRLRGDVPRRRAIRRVAKAPPTLGSVVEAAFRVYADRHDKPRWGDKRPAYSGFIAQLFAMFPDAQYVNLVRDPRGAVASQLSMGWDAPEIAVAAATARWEGAIARTDHFARDLRPDQLLDVRYEDMVADPHAVVTRICAFAGLTADEAAVESILVAERHGQFSHVHARLAEPVNTASVERWRARLRPEEVALVEQATVAQRERFGFRDTEHPRASPAPEDVRKLARQRRISRREWRTSQRGEVIRRLRYRYPVAAVRR